MQYLLFISFILLVLFYDFFSKYLNITFIDELLVGTIFIWSIYLKLKYKIKFQKQDRYVLYSYILLVLIGLGGSLYYKLQSFNIVLMDFLILSKFFISFLSMRIILIKKSYDYKIKKNLLRFLTIVFLLLLILILIDRSFNLFPIFDYKYFNIASEELFLGHPSRFAFLIEIILILLLPFVKKNNWFIFYLLLIGSIGILSLRSKYFIFFFIFILFLFSLKFLKLKKLSLKKIILYSLSFFIFGYIFFYQDIINHFLIRDDGTQGVRGLLLLSGFDISLNNFPLGSGFGTFGSYASTVSYSPLYYKYHFDVIPGCMPDKPSFLADNFYAMLLGEFGFLGIFIFLYILYILSSTLIQALNEDKENRYYYLSGLLAIYLLLFESFSDSIVSQNRGMFIAIYLAYIVTKATNFKTNKNKQPKFKEANSRGINK